MNWFNHGCILVMGPGEKFLTRVGSAIYGLGLEFGKFPLKMSNFSKLLQVGSESTRVKAGSASYLLRVKSKLGSGRGPSLVYSYQIHSK